MSPVFVLTMRAVAGPGNVEPDGRRYDLLVFARGSDEAAAEEAGRRGLDQLGWVEAQTVRVGEITDPGALPEDFRDSFDSALAQGCSIIVYDQP